MGSICYNESMHAGICTPVANTSHSIGWLFLCPLGMYPEQNERVLELWRAVIDMAIKDEDYGALAALPTDLFIALGIQDPLADQEELDGHIFAPGCGRTDPHIYGGDRNSNDYEGW